MPCEASLLFDADCLHLQFEPSLVKKVEDKTAPQNKRPARKANVCMPLWISVGCHADHTWIARRAQGRHGRGETKWTVSRYGKTTRGMI